MREMVWEMVKEMAPPATAARAASCRATSTLRGKHFPPFPGAMAIPNSNPNPSLTLALALTLTRTLTLSLSLSLTLTRALTLTPTLTLTLDVTLPLTLYAGAMAIGFGDAGVAAGRRALRRHRRARRHAARIGGVPHRAAAPRLDGHGRARRLPADGAQRDLLRRALPADGARPRRGWCMRSRA